MAPAGSLSILKAAIDAGADAVYFGTGAFNARMNAENIGTEQLKEACDYTHLRGSKVYLTLNTIVNDGEIEEAISTAVDAYRTGVDGFIVQDIGLSSRLSKEYPMIPIIASTQMNIFSNDELKKLSDAGFKRVVLPRELSVSEIASRTRTASTMNLETEVFIHGAVCVCYSGLCLFSSMNKSGSRSGNRGLCAQPCRQEYDLFAQSTKIKTGHLLSPKDRCAAGYLKNLIESGVASFKIEGRMRDEAYVVATVRAYRLLIDAYYDGTLDDELVNGVMNDLLVSFNRGGSFTSQSLSGKKDESLLSGEYVGKYGLRLGALTACDSKKGTVTFSYNDALPLPGKGDYLSIRSGSDELCSFPVGKVHEAPKSLSVKGLHPDQIDKISKSKASVFLMSHDYSVDKDNYRKTHINFSINATSDYKIKLDARVNSGINKEIFAEYEVDVPLDYEGAPLADERIELQLRKTGDTPFVVDYVFNVSNRPISCKISLLNELRRGALENLVYEITSSYERVIGLPEFDMFGAESESTTRSNDSVTIKTMHIFPSFKLSEFSLSRGADIYGFSFFDLEVNGFRKKIVEFLKNEGKKLCVVLPDFYHDRTNKSIRVLFENLKEELGDLFYACMDSKLFGPSDIYTEFGLKHYLSGGANLFNSESVSCALALTDGCTLSYELSSDEAISTLESVKFGAGKEILVNTSGPIAWMQSDFCPIGANQKDCHSCFDRVKYTLKGDGEKECTVVSHPDGCCSTIYGPSKFNYDDSAVNRILDSGFSIIKVVTEIEEESI